MASSIQLDFDGSKVLLQPRKLAGSRYRYDPWLLGQQPREGELRKAGLLRLGDGIERSDQALILCQGILFKARMVAAGVTGAKGCIGCDGSGVQTLP